MRRISAGALALSMGVGGAAVASAPAEGATHHKVAAVSKKKVGAEVLAIIKKGNAAVDHDKGPGNAAAFNAVSQDFATTASELQALKYPSGARSDAKALVAVLNKLSFDASKISGNETNALLTTIENDEGTEVADSDSLRHDLGLPSAKV